ncbi:TetR/AcrR family transcriptional regulator [Nocardiopsis sp. ATB16-24]|uniref:TetR/AcrR family transcriptional regulator n=1 Tax=Nocardiopsis sp. ATB16-24 TaxID=3019555 RepID=UPI002553FC53|nr:TetR/AcrR family transcriptional regulator [Nocardiopsis sp. ATB16-24]
MARQERSERTRVLLIQAAGVELVRSGYAGTTLNRVSSRAGVTIGALTFHFPSKAALAEAVCEWGAGVTRCAVQHATQSVDSPWSGLDAVLRILTELLREEAVVRAAARLSREWTEARPRWRSSWIPTVESLVDEAWRRGSLAAGTDPEAVMELVELLTTGAEAVMVRELLEQSETGADDVRSGLPEIWRMVLPALARVPRGGKDGPGTTVAPGS